MNRQTPTKTNFSNNSVISPVALPKSPAAESPQKNLTGPPRVIRDIIADLHNTIQNWNSQHINGCTLVKQISSWKANETKFYSPELEELATQLSVVVSALRINCDTLNLIQSQAEAFTKLPGLQNPVFFSLSAQDMSRLISDICRAYNGEIKTKQFVLENIPHSKRKDEAMFLAAYWTHQLHISDQITLKLESLLVESNHRPIK